MGDHQNGASVHRLFQAHLHGSLGFGIQGASGFVQQEDGRIAKNGSSDGHPLQLAAGDVGASLLESGVVAVR